MTLYPLNPLNKKLFCARNEGEFRVVAAEEIIVTLQNVPPYKSNFKVGRRDATSLDKAKARIQKFPPIPGKWSFQIFDHTGQDCLSQKGDPCTG
jgi:hypothetical protein